MPNHAQSSRWRYPDPDCLYSRGWHWWSTKRTLLIAVLTTRTLKNLVAERGTLVESYKTGAHWATFRLTFVLKALKHGTPWTTYRLAILRQRPCQSSSTYTRFYVGSMGVAILGCSTNVFFFFSYFWTSRREINKAIQRRKHQLNHPHAHPCTVAPFARPLKIQNGKATAQHSGTETHP